VSDSRPAAAPSARLKVGVTGGIGSGKSALTDRLEARGIAVVDADRIAREVVAPGTPALAAIAVRFGRDILHSDGSLDRAALRRIVFADPQQRLWLEGLTHPLIARTIVARLAQATSPYAVLSSPLLLEGSQRELVDYVVVVDVPPEVQLARTMARDDNSEELVRAIMRAQMVREERSRSADTLIDNSGTLESLADQVEALHRKLLVLAEA
jgi:dephospho-CoA kinase